MKLFLSTDFEGTSGIVAWEQIFEGTSGIVAWEQIFEGNPEYEQGRRLLTDEVNAVITGENTLDLYRSFVTVITLTRALVDR